MVGGHQNLIQCAEGVCMIGGHQRLNNHKDAKYSSHAVSVIVIAWL